MSLIGAAHLPAAERGFSRWSGDARCLRCEGCERLRTVPRCEVIGGVGRRVGDARRCKRIPSLAALAAQAAVNAVGLGAFDGIHARQGELERHAECHAATNHVFLFPLEKRRRDLDRMIEPERERARHRREEFRPRVRKGVAGERAERDAAGAGRGGDHAGLGEQHEVASSQIDVLVRRVVGGRHAANRPVRRWIDVAHRELDARERRDAAANTGAASRRSIMASSAASHASPTLT